jgi:hypothetical protein
VQQANNKPRRMPRLRHRAPAVVVVVVVQRHPWAPGDQVTMDYRDGVAPYVGTVDSVGATGEVLVAFDDVSSAALKTPAQRARLALQPGVQLLNMRKGAKWPEHIP